MLQDLTGSVAWVTGAGTGIGKGIAGALAAAGATVICSGRRMEPLQEAVAGITGAGGKASALTLDVTDADAVDRVTAEILGQHGRIDILVNNAGMNIPGRTWDRYDRDAWDTVYKTNLSGLTYCVGAVLPAMRKQGGGTIVNISSWAGRYPYFPAGAAYSAAKHAVSALTTMINMEECANNIRATAICPEEVNTPIMDRRPSPPPPEDRAKMLQPEDLGEAVLLVCRLPGRACVNELVISPTRNRGYLAASGKG